MEAIEIPSEARVLGKCAMCKQRQICSWKIGSRLYCEECSEKKRGVVKDVIEIPAAPGEFTAGVSSRPFALQPKKTINLSIGELDTGWVISIDGSNHVFTTKAKMMKGLDGMIKKDEFPMEEISVDHH